MPDTLTVKCGRCHYIRQLPKTLEINPETKSQFECPCRVRPHVQKRRMINSEMVKINTDEIDTTAYWRVCEFCHRFGKWLHPGQKFECPCRKPGAKVVRVTWGKMGMPLAPTVPITMTPADIDRMAKEVGL